MYTKLILQMSLLPLRIILYNEHNRYILKQIEEKFSYEYFIMNQSSSPAMAGLLSRQLYQEL